ncbi:class I SAM-dependent methyltransferase [Evansella cellulosilytica]|uniref:Methyltransferase type 11 n=1 Tax=Evansella cellulosilytica (strain ATCC 21833 / DSM 2522 / FERM P-1141 / JCM 9156 / N-4) TaxID=649639 RepID=E6TR57_EVAC2|nr:class I SAM-dependent methyltransferase [Evansella cellulosilytica]ADU30569.1 Methyltransferase type 11 [Evansella cellulosilytica DSM 2522]
MSFYHILSKYYDVIFPINPVQTSFVKSHLKDNTTILDIAAGSGNLAIELAQQGHHVTAIDLDPRMIDTINHKKNELGISLSTHVMDMRKIDSLNTQPYDTVVCVGNSLVHLNSIAEIKNCLKKAYLSLQESGSLIIQIVNFDRVVQEETTKLPLIERKENGITFKRTYQHENGRIIFHGELTVEMENKKEVFNNSVDLYPLTSRELMDVLEDCHFKNIECFGSYKGEKHTLTSPAIIVVAKK